MNKNPTIVFIAGICVYMIGLFFLNWSEISTKAYVGIILVVNSVILISAAINSLNKENNFFIGGKTK